MLTPETANKRSRLREILLQRSLQFGDFRLSSGATSTYYIDVRKTNLDSEGISLVAKLLIEATGLGSDQGPNAVGGPTLGADPMVTALGLEAYSMGREVDCFLVRKESKGHGAARLIEGNLPTGSRVLVVDDVLTGGGSMLRAIAAIEAAGSQVAAIGCVVDREAGGREKLALANRPVHSIFRVHELLEAAGRPSSA